MQKLELQWKEGINVDLVAVDEKLRAEYGDFKGSQGAVCLELWFTVLPDEEDQQSILDWWNALTSESEEVTSYRSQASIDDCIKSLKEGIPAKTWNQLTIPERKLVLGINPTKAELIAAELL